MSLVTLEKAKNKYSQFYYLNDLAQSIWRKERDSWFYTFITPTFSFALGRLTLPIPR